MPFKLWHISEVDLVMNCEETERLQKGRGGDTLSVLEERIAILEYSICLVSKKVDEIEKRFP
ncbi:MAG: hypothetical protein ABC606_07970 [Candidatus Methanosuratincola petrocarbonis]